MKGRDGEEEVTQELKDEEISRELKKFEEASDQHHDLHIKNKSKDKFIPISKNLDEAMEEDDGLS